MNPFTAVTAMFFTGAGIGHFTKPDFFEAVVPDWFPNKKLANYGSGAAEIVLGLGLLHPKSRTMAGYGLLGLTAAVFPANIDMAINKVDIRPDEDGRMARYPGEVKDARNWIRLPFQLVFVWLIHRASGNPHGPR